MACGQFVRLIGVSGTADLLSTAAGPSANTNFEPPPMPSRAGNLCNCGCEARDGESPLPPGNGLQGVEDCYLVC